MSADCATTADRACMDARSPRISAPTASRIAACACTASGSCDANASGPRGGRSGASFMDHLLPDGVTEEAISLPQCLLVEERNVLPDADEEDLLRMHFEVLDAVGRVAPRAALRLRDVAVRRRLH